MPGGRRKRRKHFVRLVRMDDSGDRAGTFGKGVDAKVIEKCVKGSFEGRNRAFHCDRGAVNCHYPSTPAIHHFESPQCPADESIGRGDGELKEWGVAIRRWGVESGG